MNKKELVAAMAEKAGITKVKAEEAINAIVDVISEELTKGGDVTVYGLGKFAVKDRAARNGRNPQTGEAMTIPASKAPSFKASKVLKDTIKNS